MPDTYNEDSHMSKMSNLLEAAEAARAAAKASDVAHDAYLSYSNAVLASYRCNLKVVIASLNCETDRSGENLSALAEAESESSEADAAASGARSGALAADHYAKAAARKAYEASVRDKGARFPGLGLGRGK